MTKTISGCGAKEVTYGFKEVDGQEFDVSDLDGLLQVLKLYKIIHLNYCSDSNEDLDLWIKQLEVKMDTKQQIFSVPNMNLHRKDLTFMDTKGCKLSQELSNQQMEEIANQLSKLLAQEWDMLITKIKTMQPRLFEVE